MAIEILLPSLSPTMREGKLYKWLVKVGDSVAAGDVIAEIETDKAVMEFEAVDEGVIGQILIEEGTENIPVKTQIATLLEEGESIDNVLQTPSPSSAPMPKQTAENEAPQAPQSGPAQKSISAPAPQAQGAKERIFATPLARRLAQESGIDIAMLTGSGPKGRIVKADVLAAATQTQNTALTTTPQAAVPAASATDIETLYQGRTYEVIPLSGMRKTVAARLSQAKATIPHFYLRRDVKVDPLLALRAQMNAKLSERGIKISVNDFIIKACALALQDVPKANVVWADSHILQMQASDIAVAVAVEDGLFTPVLKDAEKRPISDLSNSMKDLASRARDRKLALEEYQGGSFSISNLGMMGVESFDAVINPPHGAILAVGSSQQKPIVDAAGEFAIATVMSLTLSVDHRAIDGALGATLLAAIVSHLEHPAAMLA